MGLVQILDHLYLGALSDVVEGKSVARLAIQAIFTVDSKPLSSEVFKRFESEIDYKHIPLLDLDSEDVLVHLDDAVFFIDTYRTKDKDIAVHCNAGQSRSAAVVIAYLMWKLQMSFDDSLQYLRKLKPDVSPNRGFEEQLRLYEFMGYTLDRSCKAYRQYQLERISDMLSSGRAISQLGEMLSGAMQDSAINQLGDSVSYKCKKCRRLLFIEGHLIGHTAGVGDVAFSRPWQKITRSDHIECKASLFIEPMKWMERLGLSETMGKICCVKCSAKIGSWSWSGERCTCGTWVTPAFRIDVKKVDKAMSVRLPTSAAIG